MRRIDFDMQANVPARDFRCRGDVPLRDDGRLAEHLIRVRVHDFHVNDETSVVALRQRVIELIRSGREFRLRCGGSHAGADDEEGDEKRRCCGDGAMRERADLE